MKQRNKKQRQQKVELRDSASVTSKSSRISRASSRRNALMRKQAEQKRFD